MANPLKVLTALSASSGAEVSGSEGLKIKQGGLTIGVGAGTAAVQALTATTISGSSTLDIGGTVTFAGAVNAQNGLTVTNAALNAAAVTASSLNVTNGAAVGYLDIGGGFGSTGASIADDGKISANGLTTLAGGLIVTGSTNTSGSVSIGGNGGLTVANGLTVTAGTVSLPTTSIANAALQGSGKVTVGSTDVALGAAVTAFAGLTELKGASLVVDAQQVTASAVTASGDIKAGGSITAGNQLIAGTGYSGTGATISANNGNIQTKGSGTFDGDLTVKGNLYLTGTTVFVNTENLLVKDPIVLIGSASNPSAVDVGLVFGGQNRQALKWDYSATQFVLGATTSDGSGASIAITGLSDLKVGSLTGSGALLSSGSLKDYKAGFGPSGVAPATGSAFGLAGFENNAHVAIVSASYHGMADIEATILDAKADVVQITANGGEFGLISGFAAEANGVSIISNHAKQNGQDSLVLAVSSDGGSSALADGSIKLKAEAIVLDAAGSVSGTIAMGPVNIEASNSYNFITRVQDFGVDSLNVSGAFSQLDSKLNEVSGAVASIGGSSVSPAEYYGVRAALVGTLADPNSDLEFHLLGTSGFSGNVISGSSVTGLVSTVGSSDLLDKLSYASFDVAVKANASSQWTNDLVSVTVTAVSGASGWYPKFAVGAPGLAANSSVRLIVVNEKANVIS